MQVIEREKLIRTFEEGIMIAFLAWEEDEDEDTVLIPRDGEVFRISLSEEEEESDVLKERDDVIATVRFVGDGTRCHVAEDVEDPEMLEDCHHEAFERLKDGAD